jgi:5-amino-6-(5-phosphoribosylamino)uracil reductase/diaminohydroxyphosphoribosylaminopyrimidine deaminase/5-amino-6-(5-phosphoribosylamino)uracil reductase
MKPIPRITVSYAQSLDGRIATSTGDSRWISCTRTLTLAHRLRRDHEVILVGIGTVLRDDPELSCRLKGSSRSPVRVVLDSHLRLPPDSTIVRTCRTYRTIVYTLQAGPVSESGDAAVVDILAGGGSPACAAAERRAALEQAGIEVLEVPADAEGRVSIVDLVNDLAERGFRSIFVEGGARVITSFLRAGLVHRMVVVTAPVIIGRGVEAIGELGITSLSQALRPARSRVRRLGSDRVWELIFDGD